MDINHRLESRIDQLNRHPVYDAIRSIDDLRVFMEHHIYSVWDFMSLIKHLQSCIAPTSVPWAPVGDPQVRRFINELVLEEESDRAWPGHDDSGFCSHFELYQSAMHEVGADPSACLGMLERIAAQGIDRALAEAPIPEPSRQFTRTTFDFIQSGRPHEVAAALAVGREHIIPTLFRAILARFGVSPGQAPVFHYYLNRHVHLDEDFHAPMSIRLMETLCAGDEHRRAQAADAAARAIDARLRFWDGVHHAIMSRLPKAEEA
jgi:hypothetical protein